MNWSNLKLNLKYNYKKVAKLNKKLSWKIKGALLGLIIGLVAMVLAFISLFTGPGFIGAIIAFPTFVVGIIWASIIDESYGGSDYFVIITFITTPIVYTLIGFSIGYLIDRKRKVGKTS